MSYDKAQAHFKQALKHLDAKKDPAMWNLVSGLIELAKAGNDSDALGLLSDGDQSTSGHLARIEQLLRQMQKDR